MLNCSYDVNKISGFYEQVQNNSIHSPLLLNQKTTIL